MGYSLAYLLTKDLFFLTFFYDIYPTIISVRYSEIVEILSSFYFKKRYDSLSSKKMSL